MPTPDEPADYYDEFDIPQNATAEQASKALDRAHRTWMGRASRAPDPRARRRAEDMVETISQARRTLTDPSLRAAYDRTLRESRGGGGRADGGDGGSRWGGGSGEDGEGGQRESEARRTSRTETRGEPKSETRAQPNSRSKPQPESQSKPQSEPKHQPGPQPRSQPKTQPRSQQKPHQKPQPKTQPKSQPTSDTRKTGTRQPADSYARARAEAKRGNRANAILLVNQAVRDAPQNAAAWQLLGALHMEADQLAAAESEFERARVLAPRDALTHRYLADLHQRRGDHATAVRWYARAVELAPADIGLRAFMAKALYTAGRYDEAMEWYEGVHVANPAQAEVRDRIGELWALRAEAVMVPSHTGVPVVPSREAAERVIHCVDQALARQPVDERLLARLRGHRAAAVAALGPRRPWHGVRGGGGATPYGGGSPTAPYGGGARYAPRRWPATLRAWRPRPRMLWALPLAGLLDALFGSALVSLLASAAFLLVMGLPRRTRGAVRRPPTHRPWRN